MSPVFYANLLRGSVGPVGSVGRSSPKILCKYIGTNDTMYEFLILYTECSKKEGEVVKKVL